MLEDESSYRRFSQEACGEVVFHTPGPKKEGVVPWTEEFVQRYGELGALWFMNEDGVVDESSYRHYLETGMFRACWGCHPCPERNREDEKKGSEKETAK